MSRIAFVAVSGVRIYNQKLVERGLTLPGFVERAQVIASMPSLGLLTLAALTPEHHDVRYLECPEYDEAFVQGLDADLVALSSFTAKSAVMYRLADGLRARGITVVLGGLHCTLVPDEAQAHADALVVGEGEPVWPLLLRDFEAGSLRPRYGPAPFHSYPLSAAPLPRYELLDLEKYNRLSVQTARGCPLHCEFCAASRVFGGFKCKPVEQVTCELEAIKQLWATPFIELADDNTFVDKKWSRELVTALGAAGVPWFTETDVSVADDPRLLDLLAESGCRQLLIGLEAPNAAELRGLDASGFKARRGDSYLRAIDAIQSRGISVNGCFILGLDTQGPGVFADVERFVERSGLTEVQVTVLTPFPGTSLYRRLAAEGRLLFPGQWDRCTLFDVAFQPRQMTVEQLEEGLAGLMGSLYSSEATRHRKRLFARNHRSWVRRSRGVAA
jgi:radical SAM superfamily enzyme YgiQ (UPF0313 family)